MRRALSLSLVVAWSSACFTPGDFDGQTDAATGSSGAVATAGSSGAAGTAGSSGAAGTGGVPSTCGDGVRDGTEACDGADLGGATCASVFGTTAPIGPLACRADCTLDVSGCTALPLGAVCTAPLDCQSILCLEVGTVSTCSEHCQSNGDCGASSPSPPGRSSGCQAWGADNAYCRPICVSDQDCAQYGPTWSCNNWYDLTTPTQYIALGFCAEWVLPGGYPCRKSTQCKSGVCSQGACQSYCASNDDCGDSWCVNTGVDTRCRFSCNNHAECAVIRADSSCVTRSTPTGGVVDVCD